MHIFPLFMRHILPERDFKTPFPRSRERDLHHFYQQDALLDAMPGSGLAQRIQLMLEFLIQRQLWSQSFRIQITGKDGSSPLLAVLWPMGL
jgi:hypothetical protein